MATMKDVALRAGVSTTTVSHIINDTRHVSEELRQRVSDAIAALNYQPHGPARSLRTKQTRTIGMIIPDNSNPFFAEVARSVALHRGIIALVTDFTDSVEKMIALGEQEVIRSGILPPGAPVVVASGARTQGGATHLVKLHRLGEA